MATKWAVAYEYDLEQGICFFARKKEGQGEVALFDSEEEARAWVEAGEDIEAGIWDINYLHVES